MAAGLMSEASQDVILLGTAAVHYNTNICT